MGQLHNELTTFVDMARGIKRAMGFGQAADEGTARVSETLQPVFDVYGKPDQAWLRLEYNWWQQVGVAAVAGQRCKSQVRNPAGSNVLATVRRVWIQSDVAGTGIIMACAQGETGANLLATLQSRMRPRDRRTFSEAVQTQLRFETSAGLPASPETGIYLFLAAANVSYEVSDLALVLPPGQALFFYPDGDQRALQVSVFGSERRMLPTERP